MNFIATNPYVTCDMKERGSDQIASCLFKYCNQLPESIDHLVLYSATCGGQNRNINLSEMFAFVLSNLKHIKIIGHKYLEPGHTHRV